MNFIKKDDRYIHVGSFSTKKAILHIDLHADCIISHILLILGGNVDKLMYEVW